MENKGNNNNNGGNNKNGMTIMIFILTALLVLFLTSLLNSCAKDATNKEITYSEFIDMVEKDKVESVTFTSSRINITPKGENKLYRITYYTAELNDESLIPLLKEHDVKFGGTVEDVSTMIMWNMLSYILPLVLVWVLLYFLIFRKMGSGGMMGVGKTTAKVYVEKSTGVTFRDVAGQDEAKESLQEVVDFLHNPRKYTDIGAKLPKGALLVGPPGTGKTLLAKAVAGEAKVPFFSLAGSDFVEMFVGVGASRVRDLFKEAQKQAPCIIFIDEIDAIGKSRDTRYGGNDEREQTLNQLLAEMDGFDTSKGLLILAATNRPEVLDKALLRPGRFDRRIIVDKPDLKGRVETLKVHAKNVLLDDSVDLDAIALATSGAVGSDLANMINEAAINAVKQGRKYVNQSDLFESVEVVIAGKEKKDRIMGPKEKKMVAYHEVGHALVTALQKDAEPVQKITIVPRTMGALGYTMQVPEEEKFLMTKNELVAHLVTYMGGRAAEEIVFDSVTTGASNDIEQATKIARAMVTQYGMSEKFGLMGLVTIESQYLDGRASLNCGEETAGQIDQEVMRILKESYDEATRLLLENREILDKISQQLYENETITGKEFMKIFRELKGIPEPEEKTEAEKAAESFQAEQEHVKQQAPTVEMQEHMKQQAPTVEIQEEEILVNTLREEDLPPELSGKEEASPEHQELEVNTLEGEEARPRQEQKVELIPVTVNMPNLQKPEAPGQMEASETMKEEAKPAVPEAKEEARPVSLEASTPEELGFFPAKKGSGKKGKSIPAKKEASVPKQQPAEEALREKQSGKGQTSSSKPEPEKTEQEAEEDYLDQLLKELK
ncbi:MAG: ATP-dependent zinc metalloprotease FtsH [Lachnospiraceae bacterium]|nr:ATP-dependent zinc metalloprotease FtsH [Lachnospiraceae bacterium]